MKKNKFSPVIIFTYNRPKKLLKLINSLKKNNEFRFTKFYLFQDNIGNHANKIEKKNYIRNMNLINELKRKKNFYVILRKNHFGLAKNIITGVSKVIKIYKKVIVLEDDLIVSKFFIAPAVPS